MRRSAERVADADVAAAVDSWTGHPAVEWVRRIGPLLVKLDSAILSQLELVPTNAAAARSSLHRVGSHNPLAVADPAVDKARHQFVALDIEALRGPWLGNTLR